MAIIRNGKIKGKIGNYVYRVSEGKEIVQAYTKKGVQTENTKKASVKFGSASKTGSKIYKQLKSFALDFAKVKLYREIVSRLRGSVYLHLEPETVNAEAWTLIPETDQLPINNEVLLTAFLDNYPSVSFLQDEGECLFSIPSFTYNSKTSKPPKEANYVEFYGNVYHTHREMTYSLSEYKSGRLPVYEDFEKQDVGFPLEWMENIEKKGIIYVCFGLNFFADEDSRMPLNAAKFNPSAVLGMWYKKA